MDDIRNLCRTCGSTINEEHDIKLFEKSNYALVTLIEDITDMWVSFCITLLYESRNLMLFFIENHS